MNVRQKLSLAALCLALPAMASAQAAPAPAAEPAAAPAAAPAPAFEIKPYGFLLLDYHQNMGGFAAADYPGQVKNEDDKSNIVEAKQSRFGWNFNNADGGLSGAKLGAKLEFDFMGAGATSWNSAIPRLRYAVATAGWDAGPGKLALTVGQTDGLVATLHPELGAYIATPMFVAAGNLTRRSPQLRVGYDVSVAGMVAIKAEVAALSAADGGTFSLSQGNASGQPDIEARLQVGVKPMKNVSITVGGGYHTNKRHIAAVAGKAAVLDDPATLDKFEAAAAVEAVAEQDLTNTLWAVDANIEVPFVNLRGEYYSGSGTDEIYTGLGVSTVFAKDADPLTADKSKLVDSSGYWFQVVVKPIPQAWLMFGMGHAEIDDSVLLAATSTSAERLENDMLDVGVIGNLSKNWKLSLQYTKTDSKQRNKTAVDDVSGSAIAFASRFTF